jgi:VWA domain-containing protein/aerotolerance regulator-like protein
MPFLAPLAIAGLAFIPLIVAFYMLRLRRQERTVSSTFLWQQLVRDVEANAPWQRLRRSLLLLLQLLLVLVLVIAAARPFLERRAGLARDLVLVMDASASMGATDEFPDRLTAAKRAAADALAELPSDGRVSIVAAAETARVVANEVSDRGRAISLIEGIALSNGQGDMTEALRLADALASRARGATILIVTDDAGAAPLTLRTKAPIRVLPVGRDRHNQAIAAIAVQTGAGGVKRSLFVSVANLDTSAVARRLQILADGQAFSARDLFIDPLTQTQVVIDELPTGTSIVEARMTAIPSGGAAASGAAGAPEGPGPADQLAADDVAWAIVPSDKLQRILLVGPGNVYLQNAISLLPNVELYGTTGEDYASTTGLEKFDLMVFDGFLPVTLPAKPILAIAPPRTSDIGIVAGTLQQPGIGGVAPDEPLLHDVDLTRTHVARAQRMELPSWARTVIPGPAQAPLLYAGTREGLPTAVMAFDLRQSDLPLQVAWPILVANLSGELLGRDSSTLQPVRPGAPVDLTLPPGSAGMRVTAPDGTVTELLPATTAGASVTFVGTTELGPYTAEPIPEPPVPDARGGTASPTPSPSPSPSEVPVAVGPIRFAVDLFDTQESNIAPGDGARLTAVGGAAATGGTPGTARDEWWVPVAVAALVLLLLEWLVYERDGARRIRGWLGGLGRWRPLRRSSR